MVLPYKLLTETQPEKRINNYLTSNDLKETRFK